MAACFQVMNMETKHCMADAKHLRRFLNACTGNWHNCIHVTCPRCQAPGTCAESGFLFCPDEKAAPLILPLSDARILFARYPEPDETLCTMNVTQFLCMYDGFLKEKQYPDSFCPCMALFQSQVNDCYEW